MQSRLTGGLPAKLTQGPRVGHDLSRMGAGAARGPGAKQNLVAAAWSGTWPAPGSTLDLDFANNRGWVRGVGQGGVMDAITFTRASNATYVGEDGLLKSYANQGALGKNLLTFPQDFDNAIWTNINNQYWPNYSVISANAGHAPDGSYTADAFFDTAGQTGNCQRSNGPDVAATYSLATPLMVSCYVKSISHRYFNLIAANDPGSAGITVDLQTGSVTGSGGIVAGTGFVISAGDGWYRVGFQISSASTGNTSIAGIKVGLRDNPDYTFTAGRYQVYQYAQQGTGVLVWGAQLEQGTVATEYFPTNFNVPRFDWASTEVVQNTVRKNAIQYSDSLNLFTARSVAVTYGQDDPFGGTKAALTVASPNSDTHTRIYGFTGLLPGQAYTASIYLKGSGLGKLAIGLALAGAGLNGASGIDLASGVIYPSGAYSNHTLTNEGGGYYRYSFSFVAVQATAIFAIYVTNSSFTNVWTGDGVSGFYGFGAQLEPGAAVTAYESEGYEAALTPLRPTPTCNGLLIEEARTNRLLWCRDATQSNWVKTDITAAKDQTGIDGVANAASSLTATADGGTCIQTITLASESRTCSVYLKRLTGAGIVQVSLDGTTWSTVDLSADEWRRIVLSGTVTNPVVGIRLAVSGDAVAMDFGQVEDGAFATTPILTTGASATRSGDAASIPVNTFDRIANHGEMSFFATFSIRSTLGSSQTHVFNYSPQVDVGLLCCVFGSGSNTIRWGVQTGSPTLATTFAFGQEFTVAGSYSLGFSSLGKDGMSTSINRDVTVNGGLTRPLLLSIGSAAHLARQMNGTIKRLVINGFYLDDSQVAALSLSRGGT